MGEEISRWVLQGREGLTDPLVEGPPIYAGERLEVMPVAELLPLVEAARHVVHQIDPQVSGSMSEKAVSPDRREHWIKQLRIELEAWD